MDDREPKHPDSDFWQQLRQSHHDIGRGRGGAFVTANGEAIPLNALLMPPGATTVVFLRLSRPAGEGQVEATADALDAWIEAEGIDRQRFKFVVLDRNMSIEGALAILADGEGAYQAGDNAELLSKAKRQQGG